MKKPVAPGIYRTKHGFRAFVQVRNHHGPKRWRLKTHRFSKHATVTEMKQWQEDQRVSARKTAPPTPDRGTFAEDIERYLKLVAAMPTYEGRKRDLHTWREVFGDFKRSQITTEMIRGRLQLWRTQGPVIRFNPRTKAYTAVPKPLSASACNHRRTALLHLWTVLDGRTATNPVKDAPVFAEPPAAPRAKDIDFLEAAIARMQNAKDRARASVLLWTGVRGNSELGKAKPENVSFSDDEESGECQVPTGKGGKRYRFIPLNVKGVAAWKAFSAASAWGSYDKNLLRKSFQRACRAEAKARNITIEPTRVYDLRHSLATAYLKAGADVADVQDILGHTTPRMTRRYAPQQRQKLLAAAKKLA